MRQLFFTLISLSSLAASAQTKEIAFESHSGNPDNFKVSLTNEVFDNDESDFGLPAYKTVYKLDSVIFLSDSQAVLVGKKYQRDWNDSTSKSDKMMGATKDTMNISGSLSRKNSADEVKKVISQWGQYETGKKTKVVGLETKQLQVKSEEKPKQQFIPVGSIHQPPDNSSPFDGQWILMFSGILALSMLGGWLTWKFYHPKLDPHLS